MSIPNIERVKDFPPEAAGSRVGWVSVGEVCVDNPNDRLLTIDVVTATVGQNGAWQGYRIVEADRPYRLPRQDGFLAVAGISAALAPLGAGWSNEPNLVYRKEGPSDKERADLIARGTRSNPLPSGDDGRSWAASRAEIIDLLKQKLTDNNASEKYAPLYYWLNGSVARGSELFEHGFYGLSLQDLLLPDKDMHSTTLDQISNADLVVSALTACISTDERMKQRLTVFSDIPAELVPISFIESRCAVGEFEKDATEHAAQLAVKQLVYLPVGSRSGDRSKPYMDAVSIDDTIAFGRELSGLVNREIEPANHELEKEIAELRKRRDYAEKGKQRLQDIANAEAIS